MALAGRLDARAAGIATAIACLATVPAAAAGMSPAEMRGRTAAIAARYLAIWSSDDGSAVSGVPWMYGPTVRYFGREYTQDDLVAEKRRAIRRWPVRRYSIRPGTLQVTCNERELKCGARAVTDFEVADPARGIRRSGSARFDLGVSYAGARPRILYEDGSRRGG